MEGSEVSYVESDDETVSSSVISFGDCMKTLLTCCVPYLKFDFSLVERENFFFKINPNSGDICLWEVIVDVSANKGSFTNSSVSYHKNFEYPLVFSLKECLG